MMRFRFDDYAIKTAVVYRAEWGRQVLVPHVTLYFNGGVAWSGASLSVAHHLQQCRKFLGSPPWRDAISLEIRCVGVDGEYLRYAVC